MPIKVLLFGQYGQSSHLSPLQDFKHKKKQLSSTLTHTHTHTHLRPSFHQVIFMETTEPETSEFIQVLLSCREKPFCITAVVLLKPFNQNQRASTYRGEDSHRKEAVESPTVLVPAAAEARGTAGACLGAEAPARSGCSRPRLLCRTPRVGQEQLFLPKTHLWVPPCLPGHRIRPPGAGAAPGEGAQQSRRSEAERSPE